ncbi:hypothetical protein GCM10017559_80840 [Streptosporangium longisporum]|uniref:Secreted protein n=1 Tax=Streptosporangium longisporum TaxID=46187 RepID=A0ABP6LDC1_9ACTN
MLGRTLLPPSAGLIFMTGAAGVGVLEAAGCRLGPGAGLGSGVLRSGPPEQAVASTAAVARARPASGVLRCRRSTISTISLPHYNKVRLKH